MKKIQFTFFLFVALTSLCAAQYTTVNYDFERNWFNEGQPLPAEQSMVFKGMVPSETQVVELAILSSKNNNELYKTTWQKTKENEFTLIVPYKLRASNQYDFALSFFKKLPEAKRVNLENDINEMLNTYIDVNLSGKGKKSIKFLKKSKRIVKEMNAILLSNFEDLRTRDVQWKPEFSEIVKMKIEQLERAKLDKDFVKGEDQPSKREVMEKARATLVDGLKTQVNKEIGRLMQTEMFFLTSKKYVDNYLTASKNRSIAINAGYGGVYLSGEWDNLTYGASPYVGIAFPLGNSVLGSKFLSNTSVTLGVFLEDFEDENNNTVSGLIVNRPIYLGLDHKLFKFIRVNAGATFLEGMNVPEGAGMEPTRKAMVRPYLGLSARIDLSLGLGK
ncbi:MAG: hypothetical protein AAF573_17605 [Bacteroidota bacterium]